MGTVMDVCAAAAELAETFWTQAANVDTAERVPAGHLDALARHGFYGLDDFPSLSCALEHLASGCLATAFVWLQHHGVLAATAHSAQPVIRDRWLEPLRSGALKGGIARAGARPGRDVLRIAAGPHGYRINGEIPWVTGWGLVDVLHVAAVDDRDQVVFVLMDAQPAETMTATRQDLIAAQASCTVTLSLVDHHVPSDRLTAVQPREQWLQGEASGSALNGFLALGIARRCCQLLGDDHPLWTELADCRILLQRADRDTTPAARAAACELAMRAAATLAVHLGSRAVLQDGFAQRLIREAAFLLVFGSRPAIRDQLLGLLTRW